MVSKNKNIGLIIAGGVGRRMNNETPKQFLVVNDKPVIVYTLEAFQNNPQIDEIVVVIVEDWKDLLLKYVDHYNLTKVKHIALGGDTGQESIYNGVKVVDEHYDDDDIIIIHDAVRPLVNDEIINANISGVHANGNAITTIPATEALLYSEDGLMSEKIVDRSKILRTQTPQSLYKKDLVWAHEEAARQGITNSVATCTLLVELGKEIYSVMGLNFNFKITTEEDIGLFKSYLEAGVE